MLSRETLTGMIHDVFSVCNDYGHVEGKDLNFDLMVDELERYDTIPTSDDIYDAINKELENCGYEFHADKDFQWLINENHKDSKENLAELKYATQVFDGLIVTTKERRLDEEELRTVLLAQSIIHLVLKQHVKRLEK